MVVAIILSVVVAMMWSVGTALVLEDRRGQRFGGRGAHLPMSTKLLWCCGPFLLALASNAFYGQPREPDRLAAAVVVALVLLSATMIVPIVIHNARLSQAR